MSLFRVTFANCLGHEGGAFDLRCQGAAGSTVNMTVIHRCHSGNCGAFYRSSDGSFNLTAFNISETIASQCVGAFEAKGGSLRVVHAVLAGSRAVAHNGGMCLREFRGFSFEFCLFARCSHTSSEFEAGAVLLVYASPAGAAIRNSAFRDNLPGASFSVSVASGARLLVSDCCFTGARARELRPVNVDAQDCEFEDRGCDAVMPWASDAPGHTRGLGPRTGGSPPTIWGDPAPGRKSFAWLIFGSSAALSVATASLLTAVHIGVQRWLKARKEPKAFQ
jgi:hypothetical protein